MKQPLKIITLALTSILVFVTLTFAQTNLRARGLYRSGQSDGMNILILRRDGDRFSPVEPTRTFQKGDQIKVTFESNFDGYVYIVNVTPGGKKRVLFPYDKESNRINRSQRYELPTGAAFIFDEEKGTEIVQVIMSREAIPLFDNAIKDSKGELGESASSAAAELSGDKPMKTGIVSENVTPVLPNSGPGKLRARGIILAPGKDGEGTYVAIPDKPEKAVGKTKTNDKDATGRLKSGEVAVFEIRLQHT